MTKKIALLFRTHVFDESVLAGYRQLRAAAPENVDVFFVCDETHGAFDAPTDILKAGHSHADIQRFGLLPFAGPRALWHSGDYAFYFFYDAHPGYDLYLMVEFDVYFTDKALAGFFEYFQAHDADMYGVYFCPAAETWRWYQPATAFYDTVFHIFGPIIGLSNRAVSRLYMSRVKQTQLFQKGMVARNWANVEAYVPSEVMAAGYSVLSLETDLNIRRRFFNPVKPVCADTVSRAADHDEILHPVLPPDAYLLKVLRMAGNMPLAQYLDSQGRDGERTTIKRLGGELVAQTFAPHMDGETLADVLRYLGQPDPSIVV